MKTIVRYSNRKMYDKDTKRYTTLGEIVKLPMGTFKVEEYGSGDDVTITTLLEVATSRKVENETKIRVIKYCVTELELGVNF